MPTPAQRLALLLEVHCDSYRSAAELCGLDHTTLMRIGRGETENSASIQRIAEAYGVPGHWMRGERDIGTDFTFAVLACPTPERLTFLWDRERRAAFAMHFLLDYDPQRYTIDRLADLVGIADSDVEVMLARGRGVLDRGNVEQLSMDTGLPLAWFHTGLLGCRDEEDLLVGLAAHALTALGEVLGAEINEQQIQAAASALL